MQTQCLTALSTINTNHCIYILSLRLNFESFFFLGLNSEFQLQRELNGRQFHQV